MPQVPLPKVFVLQGCLDFPVERQGFNLDRFHWLGHGGAGCVQVIGESHPVPTCQLTDLVLAVTEECSPFNRFRILAAPVVAHFAAIVTYGKCSACSRSAIRKQVMLKGNGMQGFSHGMSIVLTVMG